MRFECRHPDGTKMTGLDAVRESMRLSMEASKAVSDLLPQPQELSYEKLSPLNLSIRGLKDTTNIMMIECPPHFLIFSNCPVPTKAVYW